MKACLFKLVFHLVMLVSLPSALTAQTLFDLNFTQFTTEDGLPSSQVYGSVQDRDGYMWFVTDNGVARFDGSTFKVFQAKDGLPNNLVFKITKDHQGKVWFLCDALQLAYYENGEIKAFEHNDKILGIGLARSNIVSQFYITKDNTFHLSCRGYKNFQIDSNGSLIEKDLIEDLRRFEILDDSICLIEMFTPSKPGLIFSLINNTTSKDIFLEEHMTSSNTVMMGRISPKGTLLAVIGGKLFELKGDTMSRVSDIVKIFHFVIVNDCIWITTQNNGVYCLDLNSYKIKANYLPGYSISTVNFDSQGGIWLTTLNNGVFYSNSYAIKIIDKKKSEGKSVRALTGNSDGTIAIGFENGILQLLNGTKSEAHITFGTIFDLEYVSGTDTLLVGDSKNLSLVVSNGKRIIDVGSIGSKLVYSNGDSLLAIYNENLFLYPSLKNLEEKQIIPAKEAVDVRKALSEAPNSILLCGWDGLFRMTTEINKVENLHPWLNLRINDMIRRGDTFYFAINDKGVLVYEPDSIYALTVYHANSNINPNTLVIDEQNNLWIGGDGGIEYIERKADGSVVHLINKSNGLPSEDILDLYLRNDTLWGGSLQGVFVLPISVLGQSYTAPKVILQSLVVNDTKKPISEESEFKHNQNRVEFSFNGIAFRSKGKLQFKYRLLGSDDNWSYSSDKQIVYSSLAPGEYTFEIYASLDKEKWSEESTKYHFIIQAAYWQTYWFWGLLAIVGLLISIAILRARFNRIKRKNELEKSVSSLKGEALKAQINPHFMFNSLNSIQKLVSEGNTMEAETYLAKYGGLLRRILNQSSKTAISVAEEMDLLTEYLQLEKLRFKSQMEFEVTATDYSLVQSTHIAPMFIQPFVENAILHGILPKKEGGKVTVNLNVEEEAYVLCTIKDNGVGRNATSSIKGKSSHQSKGISLSRERLKSIESLQGVKGSITIEDLVDAEGLATGTIVKIKLPALIPDK